MGDIRSAFSRTYFSSGDAVGLGLVMIGTRPVVVEVVMVSVVVVVDRRLGGLLIFRPESDAMPCVEVLCRCCSTGCVVSVAPGVEGVVGTSTADSVVSSCTCCVEGEDLVISASSGILEAFAPSPGSLPLPSSCRLALFFFERVDAPELNRRDNLDRIVPFSFITANGAEYNPGAISKTHLWNAAKEQGSGRTRSSIPARPPHPCTYAPSRTLTTRAE